MAKKPLRTLRKSDLFSLYQNLLARNEIGRAGLKALLEAAVVFLNHENEDVVALGYRILVMYSNQTKDYIPLYDVSLGKGYMPIIRSIEEEKIGEEIDGHFFPEYFSSLLELYRDGDAILTEQQLDLSSFFRENNFSDATVTAPTSYGKSELISSFCANNLNTNICVIVPTKALLAQTKQRLVSSKDSEDNRLIITHAEMYSGDTKKVVAVLTQERLLRFFVKHPTVNFDFVFVDEAHNLLGEDLRALLLAKVIVLQKRRNPNSHFKFLTPFLVDPKNLKTRYTEFTSSDYKVEESLKTERYYVVDFRKEGNLFLYDQYFDEFVQCGQRAYANEINLIDAQAGKKNILFFNVPKKVERFLRDFLLHREVLDSEKVERVCNSISDFLHKDYLLVDGLKKGVLYHHGSVPDIVKLYIERAFTDIPELQYIACNSTLLEGVNIPAEKMFIMEKSKGNRDLSKSQFRNLAGRICRFSEVFRPGESNLRLLEPEIFLVGTDAYLGTGGNLEKFIKNVAQVDLAIEDQTENVLLEESVIESDEAKEEKREADEFLENLLPGVTGVETERAKTPAGRSCFLNNISEIDVLYYEEEIQRSLDLVTEPLETSNEILALVANAFVPHLKSGKDFDIIRRLREPSAQSFYSMMIDWKVRGASYSEMIANFLRYWENSGDDEVYVGKWGEITREDSYSPRWVLISEKTNSEKVNLAIVRIKEEQDFVDNHLLKYVELLNDLGKLEEDVYLRIKYGTTNAQKISLINDGINSMLAGRLVDVYSDYMAQNPETGSVELRPELIGRMRENSENEILVFEAGMHLGLRHDF